MTHENYMKFKIICPKYRFTGTQPPSFIYIVGLLLLQGLSCVVKAELN